MNKSKVRALALGLSLTLLIGGCSFLPKTSTTNPSNPASDIPPDVVLDNPSDSLQTDWQAPEPDDSVDIGAELATVEEPEYEYDFYAHNPSDWQIAYKEFLDNELDKAVDGGDDYVPIESYFLTNVDDTYNEYTPELCIRTGTCEADYQLLIYAYDSKKGKVVNLVPADTIYAGHSQFVLGLNGNLFSYGAHMGYMWVTEYSDLSGKVKSEVIMEEDLNNQPDDVEYPTLKEVFGEDINYCTESAPTNPAPIIWYLNIPVATGDITDAAKMADFFDYVMDDKNKKEVYVVEYNRYCSCETGPMTLKKLLDGGMDTYENDPYLFCEYIDADMNEDGQNERLVKIVNNRGTYGYILLSYQNGIFYAYAFPYFEMNGNLQVVNFSVYHNWFSPETMEFYGFVFDQDVCELMYSECEDRETAKTALSAALPWIKY